MSNLSAVTRRGFLTLPALAAQPAKRPNLILIVTDNHGAWSLGCYGNPDIRTPHIDRLAGEGTLFTRAFSNNPVCSPTRASLLTGLMPSQHGVHRYLGAQGAQIGPRAYYTLEEFDTLPQILAESGYVTGLSGKWHLGGNLRPQDGFQYWVTMPHGASPGFYDQQVIENGQIRREPGYLTDFWTDHAVRFIRQNQARPFFLMLSYNGPYGLGNSMKEPVRNRHAAYYAEKELASMPRDTAHPWNHNYGSWINDVQVRRKYAAEISGIDDGVGRVLDTLDELKLRDDTVIVFVGDQGLSGGHSGFWGMGDHTRPLTGFDWTMWIPLMVSHRGRLAGGQRSNLIVSTYDVMPTVLDHLGLAGKQAKSPPPPGRSFASMLRGATPRAWPDAVFFEFENLRAIRTTEWKYIERIHEEPNELYQLGKDPGERLNLYGQRGVESVTAGLRKRLQAFFARYADPKWDLWKGGRSKSGLINGKLFGLTIEE
jgi:arylsulfatase A-like enzyme